MFRRFLLMFASMFGFAPMKPSRKTDAKSTDEILERTRKVIDRLRGERIAIVRRLKERLDDARAKDVRSSLDRL